MDIQHYSALFLNYCQARKKLSSKTLKAYEIDLKQFERFCHNDFSKDTLCHYVEIMHEQYKPKTVRRKIATLKAFTHFLLIEDYIDQSPFQRLDISFREPVLLPKTIPLNVINQILLTAYQYQSQTTTEYQRRLVLRDIAILEILFATGTRVSELCQLKDNSLNFETHTVKIFGKGSRERIIQIENCDVLSALHAYYNAFEDDIKATGYVFINKLHMPLKEQSVREIICKYVKMAGYELHITRSEFACRRSAVILRALRLKPQSSPRQSDALRAIPKKILPLPNRKHQATRLGAFYLAGAGGFEPATHGFGDRYSTS